MPCHAQALPGVGAASHHGADLSVRPSSAPSWCCRAPSMHLQVHRLLGRRTSLLMCLATWLFLYGSCCAYLMIIGKFGCVQLHSSFGTSCVPICLGCLVCPGSLGQAAALFSTLAMCSITRRRRQLHAAAAARLWAALVDQPAHHHHCRRLCGHPALNFPAQPGRAGRCGGQLAPAGLLLCMQWGCMLLGCDVPAACVA